MRLLLDSHSLLWSLENSPRLSARAAEAVQSSDNEVFVSYASLWEISIKISLRKLEVETPWGETLDRFAKTAPNNLLIFSIAHLRQLITLPFHHRAPFDRMLIAQALSDGLSIVGNDEAFDAYGVQRIW
jgi:PIN domain nuclease of toxin-antitoxin system